MIRQQTTANILMVRPANFGFNAETAENNAFQQREGAENGETIRNNAIREFDAFVEKLREAGVNVIVAEDSPAPVKPDAVFPNNWVTFHQDGQIITYPMFAPTRRQERSEAVIKTVLNAGFLSAGCHHLEGTEAQEVFLEGTGSIIFDHPNRLAYACLSPRTDAALLNELGNLIGYEPVVFHAVDGDGQDIYHTNVMMAMGEDFVVICMDSVRNAEERQMLVDTFARTGKEVVDISLEQMNSFAGNMLQVRSTNGQRILVMSAKAYHALTPAQVDKLEQHTALLYSDLITIETYGGGSARCMMAEIFLPMV